LDNSYFFPRVQILAKVMELNLVLLGTSKPKKKKEEHIENMGNMREKHTGNTCIHWELDANTIENLVGTHGEH
jgi:hypothetical protein